MPEVSWYRRPGLLNAELEDPREDQPMPNPSNQSQRPPANAVRPKRRWHQMVTRIRTLEGDPHYVALGMAIGVFVGVTPTIPFHTVIAVSLAFVFKGSKPAAAIGVWFANPVTIPIFYIGSFKLGTLILNKPIPFDVKFESIKELMALGLDVTLAMVVGGA